MDNGNAGSGQVAGAHPRQYSGSELAVGSQRHYIAPVARDIRCSRRDEVISIQMGRA